MPSPASLHLRHYNLPPDLFSKTHLQRRKNCRETHCKLATTPPRMSISHNSESRRCSLSGLAPLEAILFDIDGTLCDSDPLPYFAFREMLQEVGFSGGIPITEEFFVENISGRDNRDIYRILFPDSDDLQKSLKFTDDKEAMFRRLAPEKLTPLNGLHKLCKWIENRGLKLAAVTNAPRLNAELMISSLGLSDFFEVLVIGSECEQPKPFPDPYLKGLQSLKDSPAGIKAGVTAGMPVLGVGTRNPEQLMLGAGATFLIKDFNDPKLRKALEELGGAAAGTTIAT